MKVRSSVKVKSLDHQRAGEAGVVVGLGVVMVKGDGEGAPEVPEPAAIVRFDLDQPDQSDVAVLVADLQVLTDN